MPRSARSIEIGGVYHVLNRAVLRLAMFNNDAEYEAFISLLYEAREAAPSVELLAYCIMPNHWHLILRSSEVGDIGVFMHKLSSMHTLRYHRATGTVGLGPLYQGRYKAFLVDSGEYLWTVLRYVECNARRACLVERVEDWKWGSACARKGKECVGHQLLTPIDGMSSGGTYTDYYAWLNAAVDEEEREKLSSSLRKGLPFGRDSWVQRMIEIHKLQHTMRGVGRPKKK